MNATRSNRTVCRIVHIFIALVGAWLIWQSTVWGLQAFSSIVAQFPDGLSGDQIRIAYEAPVTSLQIIGAVLLAVGLFRALEFPARD